jgi:hypothetical protein
VDLEEPLQGQQLLDAADSFQRNRTSFNGNLGQLVALRGGGGIAAGFNGFCAANRADSQCFSDARPTYANVPTYSWTVMVFTHEMGHLMARATPTPACGTATTPRSTAATPRGHLPAPRLPAGGGTIMSYCHLQSVGINFNNGFGRSPATSSARASRRRAA